MFQHFHSLTSHTSYLKLLTWCQFQLALFWSPVGCVNCKEASLWERVTCMSARQPAKISSSHKNQIHWTELHFRLKSPRTAPISTHNHLALHCSKNSQYTSYHHETFYGVCCIVRHHTALVFHPCWLGSPTVEIEEGGVQQVSYHIYHFNMAHLVVFISCLIFSL